ncbi:MAG: type II toxin-antitoxin system HicA family toxin [Methylovulum miyakonense]|uniref:type II toxin-antitoxin system HicA family toxin n=1 Tax=Methylovulum miyakonense TaxID=645578 RepID=UPI003BB73981
MKLPRDMSGLGLANKLSVLGYEVTRQNGSHIRLTTQQNGQHHITVPLHDPLKVGTFSAILNDVAKHFLISRDELLQQLF